MALILSVLAFKTIFSVVVLYFLFSIIRTHSRVRRIVKGRDFTYWSFWTAYIWVTGAMCMPIGKQWSYVLNAVFAAVPT